MVNETAECHECETTLPLTDEFFYRYRGKFWVYRCKTCAHERNLKYYRDNLTKQGKKLRPRRGPSGQNIRTISSAEGNAMLYDTLMKKEP